MAIDLPPVLPPQLATQQQIQWLNEAQPSGISATIGGINVQVVGNRYLSDEQVRELLSKVEAPSDAITALTRRYYNAGYLLVGVNYFRVGDEVTIIVSQNTLKGLRGDPQLVTHFKSLVGDSDLSLAEYDRRRVLADLQASRAGFTYSISYEQHYDHQIIMNFEREQAPDYRATELTAEMSNKGSRFLGRYFGAIGGKQRFTTGTELGLAYQTAFTSLGEAGDGENFREYELRLEQPFSFGLYGIAVSELKYQRNIQFENTASGGLCLPLIQTCQATSLVDIKLESEGQAVAFSGEQILASNPQRRLALTQSLSFSSTEISSRQGGETFLQEEYPSLALGLKYSARGSREQPSYFKALLQVGAGFGGDSGSFNSAAGDDVGIGQRSGDFLVLNPQLSYKSALDENWEWLATLQGQVASDVQLPQQSQFVLGGIHSLSAYLPGVLLGDQGYLATVALRSHMRFGELVLSASAFLEQGAAQFNDSASVAAERQSVTDGGIRVRVTWRHTLDSELVLARPLADTVRDGSALAAQEADFFWRLRWTY